MSALTVRIIACTAMLLDHIGYAFGILPLRMIGRIAFPLFAYLLYNGYRHTQSRIRYAARLGAFALISQIPFSLLLNGTVFSRRLNVFFSLLMSLACIWVTDAMRQRRILRYFCILPTALAYSLFVFGTVDADNGGTAILLGALFLFFDGTDVLSRTAVGIGMLMTLFQGYILSLVKYTVRLVQGDPVYLPLPTEWQTVQIFALFSLAIIFCYNGKKGRMPKNPKGAKAVQYGFYAFYPLHMLVLWLVRMAV